MVVFVANKTIDKMKHNEMLNKNGPWEANASVYCGKTLMHKYNKVFLQCMHDLWSFMYVRQAYNINATNTIYLTRPVHHAVFSTTMMVDVDFHIQTYPDNKLNLTFVTFNLTSHTVLDCFLPNYVLHNYVMVSVLVLKTFLCLIR